MADKFQELHDKFALIMSEYGTRLKIANETKNYKDKFKYIIMNDIKDLLTSCVPIESPYTVKGSVGFGGWAYTPWIAIFDTNITTGASNGFYIVYLLNSQTKELYLTFNHEYAFDLIYKESAVSSSPANSITFNKTCSRFG